MSSLRLHITVAVCLTVISVVALLKGEAVIAGTALGALGGYVIKNGVKSS